MFHKIFNLIAFCTFIGTLTAQTCDVELLGFDPITNQISLTVLNGENCGCNEYTQQDGNTCDESSSNQLANNETISHFVFGIYYEDNYEDNDCTDTQFHPGWAYAYPEGQNTLNAGNGYTTGDTLTLQLNTFFSWDCILETPIEGECWELVVWQINLSQTANIVDFPIEYWTDTCGTCADQTQMYPDIDLSNNTLVWCPDDLPPPILIFGCRDPQADNYNPEADLDDGSCEYTIVGCTDPIACNYNQDATTGDNVTCVYCDTPGGEEICDAYHNSDGYWNWYTGLFNCYGDIFVDSVYVTQTGCNIYNSNVASCIPGIRYNTAYRNIGEIEVDSWIFHFEGPNGYIHDSYEFGVNAPSGPPYNNPLGPGQSGLVLNTITNNMVWEEGDTLWVTIEVVGQTDPDLTNNTDYVILPPYPICIEGCTDPLASNFDPFATCDDVCEYAPPPCDTIYITLPPDTIYITEIEYVVDTLVITETEFITDTIYITETEYVTDTLYIELPPDTVTIIDTQYITEYDTVYIEMNDTIYVEIIVDNYIYVTDTVYIDCDTGLPCGEDPGIGCPDWTTLHIPNTFTPNNDGINDVWKLVYDLNCWEDVEFWVFNRWGVEIYHDYGSSFDDYPYWNGSVNGGDYYVSDGVYVYIVQGKKVGSVEVVKKTGTITVFR